MTWQPGQSGNPAGRKVGTRIKRTLLREELEKDGSALAAAIKAKALEGDMTAAGLWLARLEPVLRQRGPTVEFELDINASPATQFARVMQAVSDGELTIEDAKQITDMIRQLAEVRALENGGTGAQQLIEAFKGMAQTLANDPLR
jgi:Family of unknown function (DUF5681)